MSKIYFTLFSQSYYVDTNWGFGCPSGGIRNMGDLAHHYNIPVTWLLSPKSARCEIEMLTEFHEKYGDEAAMMFRFPAGKGHHHKDERTVANTMTIDEYRKEIRRQKQRIEEYLPWANVKICGQGIRTENMMAALQAEGFIGMYGHCYCQIGTDSITDFGMPWGSFRLRPNSPHLPAKDDQRGLLAFEWTMRDLNKSMHTVRPELWSTDPNDVERGGVCSDDNVEYWKNMFIEYEKALPYNENGIWFQFHQEAHEQTWGEICHPFTKERVDFCSSMMDEFFEWLIDRPNVEFLTATQAVEKYNKIQETGTIPMFVPFKWVKVPQQMDFWQQIRDKKGYGGATIHKNALLPNESLYDYLSIINMGDPVIAMKSPPWIDSFFFYDHECQLAFDIGKVEPFIILNYLNYIPDEEMIELFGSEKGGGAVGYFIEPTQPYVEIKENNGTHLIEINNPANKTIPYGIFLWETLYPDIIKKIPKERIIKLKAENARVKYIKIIQDRGIFIRMNIDRGIQQFNI